MIRLSNPPPCRPCLRGSLTSAAPRCALYKLFLRVPQWKLTLPCRAPTYCGRLQQHLLSTLLGCNPYAIWLSFPHHHQLVYSKPPTPLTRTKNTDNDNHQHITTTTRPQPPDHNHNHYLLLLLGIGPGYPQPVWECPAVSLELNSSEVCIGILRTCCEYYYCC